MPAPIIVLSLRALLALQAPVTPPPAPATGGDSVILWFRATDAATVDSRALLDAVGVYTRDLGLTVKAAGDIRPVPADAPSATEAAAVLRAQGARLGFWCELRAGADVAVLTVVAPDAHLELHLVERTGAHEAEQYRAIALKLRSVLVGTATPEPVPPRPAPSAPSPAPAVASAADLRAEPRQPPAPPRRLFLTLGYRISTAVDSASPRHAIALDGALAFARPFEVHVGTELATRLDQQSGGDTISVFDLPVTAGARLVWRGPRFTLGAGPFATVHLLWASASGTDSGMAQSASAFNVAGGGGAEAIARLRLSAQLAGELRLFGEIPVPTTHYALRNTEVLAFGARVGAGLGLVFPAP